MMVRGVRLRAVLVRSVGLVLLATVIGGCLDADQDGGDESLGNGDLGDVYVNRADELVDADAAPYSTMLCRDKLMQLPFDNATGARVMDRCNFEVTVFNGPANEVSMAVNPTDPLNVVAGAKDYTLADGPPCGENNVWNGYYWSTDGGLTWGNGMMTGYPGGPEGPLSGNLCNTDPVLVYDGDGNVWYSGLNYRGATMGEPQTGTGGAVTGSQVYFGRSNDGGATYPDIYFSSFGDNDNIFNDKQWFAIDPSTGHMYLTWTDFVTPGGICPPTGCGQIMFSESIDGEVWTQPVPIIEAGDVQPIEQFSMPIVTPTGEVLVLWLHFGQPQAEDPTSRVATLYLTRGVPQTALGQVLEGGLSPVTVFHPALPLFTIPGSYFGGIPEHSFRSATLPVGAMDATGGDNHGCMYIAWSDLSGDDANVQTAKTCAPYTSLQGIGPLLGPDNELAPGNQFMPWIDVAPDGSVHIAFYDDRASDDRTLLDLYHAYSLDGGDTWTTQRISEVSFDPLHAYHQAGSTFIGDYIAVDASHMGIHFAWADTRHGTSDVYHAVVLKDPADGAIYQAAPATSATEPPYAANAKWKQDVGQRP